MPRKDASASFAAVGPPTPPGFFGWWWWSPTPQQEVFLGRSVFLASPTHYYRENPISGAPKSYSVAHGWCATEATPLNLNSVAHGPDAPQKNQKFGGAPSHRAPQN